MIKTDHVRAQAAVQAFDFTEKLKEFGFATGTRADIDAARALIVEMVRDADSDIERLIRDCEELGQNPYKRSVAINGREFKVAMELALFSDGELESRIQRAFKSTAERKNTPKPDPKVISQRVTDALTALMKDAGYEVCGVEHARDGSPMRIVVRDPAYASEVSDRDGGEPVVRSIAAMGSTLRELGGAVANEPSADALGLKPSVTAEQVLTVRRVVKEVIDNAEHDLMRHIQALKASGVSPYAEEKFSLGGDYKVVEYVDKALAPWRFGRSIARPIIIESIDDKKIKDALDKALPRSHDCVDQDTFCNHVRKALIERLRAVPDLPLAAAQRYFSSPSQLTIILVSPEAFARAHTGLVPRLLGLGRTPAPLALPAPRSEAPAAPALVKPLAVLPSNSGGFAVPQ